MSSPFRRLARAGMALQIATIVLIGTLLFHGLLTLAFRLTEDHHPPRRGERESMLQVLTIVPASERRAVIAAFPDAALERCGGSGTDATPSYPLGDGDCVILHEPLGGPHGDVFPLVPVLGSVAILIPLLSFWAARRVTAPLARLADSVQRLGASGEPDILVVEGPEEIRRVARAYNTMQSQIQELIAERTRMLAALSHDIRTILTRLALRLETVSDGETREKGLRDIQIMTGMVASTMAFVQGLAPREPSEPVDLASVLETLCDEYRDLDFPVTYDGPAACRYPCRPHQLGRALRNVIDNAVKYGGRADITLTTTGTGVRIAVADAGPGIPESEHERVFEPFYRPDTARNLATGGSGLGLAILRTAVLAHGGTVTLANRDSGGLIVTIDLPEPAPSGSGTPRRSQV